MLVAGDAAGVLTAEGARLLDPTGQLQAGIPLCPPEGDAGTGMVATAVIFSSALPAMFGTFVKHRFQNTYDAILAASAIFGAEDPTLMARALRGAVEAGAAAARAGRIPRRLHAEASTAYEGLPELS